MTLHPKGDQSEPTKVLKQAPNLVTQGFELHPRYFAAFQLQLNRTSRPFRAACLRLRNKCLWFLEMHSVRERWRGLGGGIVPAYDGRSYSWHSLRSRRFPNFT